MIKRRFYKLEHGEGDGPSASSSSDFELEAEATEESSEEKEEEEVDEEGEGEGEEVDEEGGDEGDEEDEGGDNEGETNVRGKNQSHLSSSGYESENSSANEVNLDSSGLPTSDDDAGNQHASQIAIGGNGESVDIRQSTTSTDGDLASNLPDCVVKCKSVFKCRLCPRIICLSEETLQAHLLSKRHARSVKLLKEGRLKLMLDEEGKVAGETLEKQALAEEGAEAPYSVKNKRGNKRHRLSRRQLNRKKGDHGRFARKDFAKKRHL